MSLGAIKRVTVNLPRELLNDATDVTGAGTTETIIQGLRLLAKIVADLRLAGRAVPIKDSTIAATALTHDLILVTRNTGDFSQTGAKVLDPFA
jgi:hypothetical protein